MTERRNSREHRPASLPEMGPKDIHRAEEEEPLGADITHEVIRRQGAHQLGRSTSALAWSGLAAGLAMGLSVMAQGLLHSHLPDAHWRHLVVSLGYTIGFLVVILGSQQLFTESTLTAVVPLLAERSRAMLGNVARLWGVVLAANLVGALVFAWVIGLTDLFDAEVKRSFDEISREAMRGAFGTKVLKGIVAGWLIALMAWMLPSAAGSKVLVILILTYLVALAKLAHVVAGATEAFYLAVTGGQSWGAALGGYILPALIGNVIGGAILVAALNHAQVVAGGGKA
jgi:formate/nitrite transporter FocA (FNT family)